MVIFMSPTQIIFHRSLRRTLLLYNIIGQREVSNATLRHCEEERRSNLLAKHNIEKNNERQEIASFLAMTHNVIQYKCATQETIN